jgi:hypothetical protein
MAQIYSRLYERGLAECEEKLSATNSMLFIKNKMLLSTIKHLWDNNSLHILIGVSPSVDLLVRIMGGNFEEIKNDMDSDNIRFNGAKVLMKLFGLDFFNDESPILIEMERSNGSTECDWSILPDFFKIVNKTWAYNASSPRDQTKIGYVHNLTKFLPQEEHFKVEALLIFLDILCL